VRWVIAVGPKDDRGLLRSLTNIEFGAYEVLYLFIIYGFALAETESISLAAVALCEGGSCVVNPIDRTHEGQLFGNSQ